jgi:hypothetical protein
MREELVRRNYAESTIRSYLRTVEDFRRYAQKRLDQLGPDDIRRYQVYLLEERRIDIATAVSYVAALRFFYLRTLKRPDMKEDLPYPNVSRRKRRLPIILSQEDFHVVFTLPHALIPLCQRNPRVLYDLLFQASAAAMQQLAADPKHLGAQIGFLSILHTWGQNLLPHPHVHCAVPAGGLSPDQTRWVRPKYPFFLSVKALSRVFRGKFVNGLKWAFRRNKLQFHPASAALVQPRHFRRFLRTLFRQDWVVYAKPAFGGPSQVLRYLGRYTHRVAISNHRLLAFDGERVTFRWKDYVHGNKQRKMKLAVTEFLRRLMQHVLPRGFVRIRQFGFLANSCRTARLQLARELLAAAAPPPRQPTASEPRTWRCPRCGGPMRIGPILNALELATHPERPETGFHNPNEKPTVAQNT